MKGKKLELATNSIEGERSQFSFSVEGRLQLLANYVAEISIPPSFLGAWKGDMGISKKIKASFTRADG